MKRYHKDTGPVGNCTLQHVKTQETDWAQRPGKDFLVAMVTTSIEIVKISVGKGEELLRPQLWLRSY